MSSKNMNENSRNFNGNSNFGVLKEIQNSSSQGSRNDGDKEDWEEKYSDDTIKALLKKEELYKNDLRETAVSVKARSILIDWLVDIHDKYSFKQQILHCTVSILDSYTMKGVVNYDNLQLVGVTSMFLSAKNIGVMFPQINDLVYITGSYFSKDDLLSMEIAILRALEYNLNRPISPEILQRLSESIAIPNMAINFAKYFLDMSLFEPWLCRTRPSLLACAVLDLGLLHFEEAKENSWEDKIFKISSYRKRDYKEQTLRLLKLLQRIDHNKYPAVRNKYKKEKYDFVSDKLTQTLDNVG